MVSQAPISTPHMPKVTPTLPPGYHALNASVPIPTQIPSGTTDGPSSSGHSPPKFISTLPQFPFGGPSSSSTGSTNPSSTILSFTQNYQILGGQFYQGGSTQPPFIGKIPIGTQIPIPNWNTTLNWRTTTTLRTKYTSILGPVLEPSDTESSINWGAVASIYIRDTP
jgi:hypothetical protein